MKKVLWISNYGYNNSYCDVTKVLLNAYLQKYPNSVDLYLFCIGQTQHLDFAERVAKQIPLPKEKIYFPVIFTKDFSNPEDHEFMKNHILGINYFDQLKDLINPDLIISLNDIGPLVIQTKMAEQVGLNIVPYIPSDIDDLDAENKLFEHQYKAIITPSAHAQKNYQQYVSCPVHVLPHIANSIFFPIADKKALKKKWLGTEDCFVIVAVNRNNIRKRWDLLFEAFDQFAAGKDNVRMIVKTDKQDHTERFSSITAPQYNLDNYSNPKVKLVTEHVSDTELNELYNCGDVGLTMTSGEGFGLTPCEMSLCGVPQIVPNNTSHPWLFGEDYPALIDCKKYSYSVARSFLKVADIEKDLICIYKLYTHYDQEPVISEKDEPLQTTADIHTVILTPTPEIYTDKPAFRTVDALVEYLDNNLTVPRVQVLLNTNLQFIAQLDLEPLFNKQWERKKSYLIRKDYLKIYTQGNGATGLPKVESAVELLNKCYHEPDFCIDLAGRCIGRIKSLLATDSIVDKLNELFLDL